MTALTASIVESDVSQADDFQVVDVAEGKIRTKQMNQRQKLKEAKNVDEFGVFWVFFLYH